ncbi:MAG: MerR family transcriptional regulator [Lachnospiraceae bacterium]|nr:MerR family transcriptional regulator [Lachnospiraceae bacterium]
MMKLRQVSEKTGLTKRNIHFYIQEGLLSPSVDAANGYYEFTEADCERLTFVKKMRDAGMSVASISSMLHSPITATHYLNQHIRRLRQEQIRISQTLIGMNHIIDELPLYPDFSDLYTLCLEAQFPEPPSPNTGEDASAVYSSGALNRYLFSAFLPHEKFSEYQEFIWMKINRLTLQEPDEAYRKLQLFFQSLSSEQIDELFSMQSERYQLITSLSGETDAAFIDSMIQELQETASNPANARLWHKYSESFLKPTTSVYASRLGMLASELSPMFRQYTRNIVRVCEKLYQYLYTEEGSELRQSLMDAFGDSLDLEESNHGILESLVNIPQLRSCLK